MPPVISMSEDMLKEDLRVVILAQTEPRAVLAPEDY